MVIHAIYENGVFRPVHPVELPENCEVDLTIAQSHVKPGDASSTRPLSGLAGLAGVHPENPDLPSDLAQQHDHYLYGTSKQ